MLQVIVKRLETNASVENKKVGYKLGADSVEVPESPKAPNSSRTRRLVLAAIAILVLGVFIVPWVISRWTHVTMDDARIAANLIVVSSEVSGRVVAVTIIPGDIVKQGQVLVTIDREQADWQLKALAAQITAVEAQQNQLRAQQHLIQEQLASKLRAARAAITAAEASYETREAVLQNIKSRFDRVNALSARGVATAQQLDEVKTQLITAQQEKRSAEAGVEASRANVAVVQADEAQIAVLNRQIVTLDAQKSALVADREQRRIDLGRREITSAFDGVVDMTFVDPGEYVAPGSRLLIYHDPTKIWVDANVKETDFQRLKLGAPASVLVDAYPGRKFAGNVVRLGEAATSQFALLPSPNPSGNFTKITQRFPIRISIEQDSGMLRPGMMVEVRVDVLD